jgi:2-haloacid dehalogenase
MASWITFDCFGTLVDWHAGFDSILAPLAGARTPALLDAYHRVEPLTQAEEPHRCYKDVLAVSLRSAAHEVGVPMSEVQARALSDSWRRLPVFQDVEPMLAALRASGFSLGVLTNCDDDLFAQTQRTFVRPFDSVVTAEQVGTYKPALGHFRRFADRVQPDAWIHVACSWRHDIEPAHQFGIPRIWLDRDRTGDDPAVASAHIQSAAEVAAAIESLL